MEEIDPSVKYAINKEGFEGNKEGGAAVIIGKKEGGEIDRLRENVEKEGMCADVATYVRLNKKIVVPAAQTKVDLKNKIGRGWIGSTHFTFIDKEGNIAEVDIDFDKIATIPKNQSWQDKAQLFATDLFDHGFAISNLEDPSFTDIKLIKRNYQGKLEQQSKIETKEGFNF